MKYVLVFVLFATEVMLEFKVYSGELINYQQVQEFEKFRDLKQKKIDRIPGVNNLGQGVYHRDFSERLSQLPKLGRVMRPNAHVHAVKRTPENIIYDIFYTHDEHGRRWSPIALEKRHKKSLIISGCSFVYGDGLRDDETLSYFFNKEISDFYALNYGLSGGGIHNILARLTLKEDFYAELPLPPSHLIYVYIPQHTSRIAGTLPSLWTMQDPFFTKSSDGEMIYSGSIEENLSGARRIILSIADRLPDWLRKNRNIPRITSFEKNYFCDLLKATKDAWKKKSPKGTFIFMYHPLVAREEWLDSCLQLYGIPTVKFDLSPNPKKFEIIGDGHPSGELNRIFAKQIVEYLKKI